MTTALAPPAIDHRTAHLGWCRRIANRVCRSYRIEGLQALDDVTSAGVLQVLKLVPRFVPAAGVTDLEGAFRGWAYRWVRAAGRREAVRLLNGGTAVARADGRRVIAEPLSDFLSPKGREPVEPASRRDLDDRPPWNPVLLEALR
jgi:hypothetical protein